VTGIGTAGGALGGMLMQEAAGYVLEWTHGYTPLFIFGGLAYVVAWMVVQSLEPKLKPVELR
jgi:MFS transporter, ACS family, hexuronate transporter